MTAGILTRSGRSGGSLSERSARRPLRTERASEVAALAAASLVAIGLLATARGGEAPLPTLALAAPFVFLAVNQDLRERRIPNGLTFSTFALALIVATGAGGAVGLATALVGAGVAFVWLVVPYAAGWFGAGDVKATMVLGALWGGASVTPLLAWAVILGGILALGHLAARGGARDLAHRWWRTLVATLTCGRWTYFPPAPGSPATEGIPFAVALGLGAAAYQMWGTPWA